MTRDDYNRLTTFSIAGDVFEAAELAAEHAEVFLLEDCDNRGAPEVAEMSTPMGQITVLNPHAGRRLWIYHAVLPLPDHDPHDRKLLERTGRRFTWAASAVFPPGELGTVDPKDPRMFEITKDHYLAAASYGWPEMTGGQG
jgi:hypothetical protein